MNITCLQTGILHVNTYIVPCSGVCASEQGNPAFIIDPGGNIESIIRALEKNRFQLVAIVLTHGHFDHIGALASLKDRYPDAIICVHEADACYVGKDGYEMHRKGFNLLRMSGQFFFTHDELPPYDYLLEDNASLYFAPDWIVLHTPGHTPGSISLYNAQEKILFSGDTLFASSYGRSDLPGGNFDELKQSLTRLLQLPQDVTVYPGHEKSTTVAKEQNILT
ncbi:MAG: MBL fold metallo-hydrolase, partial [Spirochaetales bacterium]